MKRFLGGTWLLVIMEGCSKLADGSSEVRARMAGRTKTTRGVEVRIKEGGHFSLEKELGVLQPGYVVLMFRSPLHHLAKEGDKNKSVQHLHVFFSTDNTRNKRLKKHLEKRGFPPRDFAYVHLCVLIGQDQDNWYVVENAGGQNLVLRTLQESFNDMEGDESEYLIMATENPAETAQRAMAAYHEKFQFDYNAYGFNCEMLGSCCSGQFDKIYDQVLSMAPAAKRLGEAAENYLAKEENFETASSCQKDFVDAALDYCAALGDALGDNITTEKGNKELMEMYRAYMKEEVLLPEMLKSASAYCEMRLSLDPPMPTHCWPALLSSATVKPKGPNPLTRAQTMEKEEEKMIDLEQKRYSNLEVEGCSLMELFLKKKVAANIRGEKYELRVEDGSIKIKDV